MGGAGTCVVGGLAVRTPPEMVDAMFHLLRGGLSWRMLPQDLPMTTVPRYSYAWRDFGLWQRINSILLAAGRLASPGAGVIDRQSGKTTGRETTESGGICGDDAGQNAHGQNAPYPDRHLRQPWPCGRSRG